MLETGDTIDSFFDETGAPIVDIAAREDVARERGFARRGAMTEELLALRDRMSPGDRVHVRGFLALRESPSDRLRPEVAEAADAEIAALKERVRSLIPLEHELRTGRGVGTPLIEAVVDRDTLDTLAWSGLFMLLETHPGAGRGGNTTWYGNSGALSTNLLGWDGSARKVAIVEGGQPDNYSWLSGIAAIASPSGAGDVHPRRTAGIVRKVFEVDSNVGIAGDASIYVANWDLFSGTQPTVEEWAMSNGADVLNFSWTFSLGNNGGLSTTDLYHDWLILRSPYSMFVSLAGNDGANPNTALQFVQNRTYNGLVVGATDDVGTVARNDDTIAAFSSWKNHTTTNGDRELPEIVAPGTNVSVAGLSQDSGTSYATPVVTGAVAVIHERNAGLASWPEVQKAIVMASADCNRSGVLLNLMDATDDRDGIGLVHVSRASDLAASTNNKNSGSWPPTTRGFAYGSMNFTWDFTGSVWNGGFYLTTDSTGYLNLVLTWDATPTCSSPTSCSGAGPDADLNLYLYDHTTGALVASSYSFDNNYEAIVRALTPNRTYRVEVRKASTRIGGTYFGLAWSTFAPGCPAP